MPMVLSSRERNKVLFLILAIGIVLFVWKLGSTGLVDETPPLFAAASRAMSRTGDWLTPRVNGINRFDKPPLVYWLMSFGYSLPGNPDWDPLGTWAARLPSAFSSIFMMIILGDTVLRWPQEDELFPRRRALITALSFALSPLVLIWSRTAVSDSLLCSTLGIALIFQWRQYANPIDNYWWLSWSILGLAVLTKGPVSIIIAGFTQILFGFYQKDFVVLWKRLKPLRGLFLTAIISLPWYILELLIEGKPFWDSFFGYHNFQRFTTVVNSHNAPWWFFGLVLVIASLPFTPFLLLGIWESISNLFYKSSNLIKSPTNSLKAFAFCWLLAVFLFFSFSATKLPSYWIPATPAAAIIIGIIATSIDQRRLLFRLSWISSVLIIFLLAIVFWVSPLWLELINDPEIPNFGKKLFDSQIGIRAAFCFSITALLGTLLTFRVKPGSLLGMQIPLIFTQFFILLPLIDLADQLRQKPLRKAAEIVVKSQKPFEPIAMVGAMKPSIHFYSEKIILFEGRSRYAFVNLVDRLKSEQRRGWTGTPFKGAKGSRTTLIIIDDETLQSRLHWQGLKPEVIAKYGVYNVWRVDRIRLEKRAHLFQKQGILPNWRIPRQERF